MFYCSLQVNSDTFWKGHEPLKTLKVAPPKNNQLEPCLHIYVLKKLNCKTYNLGYSFSFINSLQLNDIL